MVTFYFFDSLPSTMDEAQTRAIKGTKDASVVVARLQTKGRGRRGRTWETFSGNLSFTYITYLSCELSQAPQLSFVACVAMGEALLPFLPPNHNLTYKWPNDLLLNGKKVGGLLLEATAVPHRKDIAYLIGCGLNLVSHPQETIYSATSFQEEAIYVPYEESLHALTISLQKHIKIWKTEGFDPIWTLWMQRAAFLQEEISLTLQGKKITGSFQGIDEKGALKLKTLQGPLSLVAGEIVEDIIISKFSARKL